MAKLSSSFYKHNMIMIVLVARLSLS